MKIILLFSLLLIAVQSKMYIYSVTKNTPIAQSKNNNCGCSNNKVDYFSAPDYGDSSKAGFYYNVLLEEAKQIASWWVYTANLMSERRKNDKYDEDDFNAKKKLIPKNFTLSQVKAQPTKTYKIENIFTNPNFKGGNLCPKSGNSIYNLSNFKSSNISYKLPPVLKNTFSDAQLDGNMQENHLKNYLIDLKTAYPHMLNMVRQLAEQKIKIDTFLDSYEFKTLLSFINEECFTVQNKNGFKKGERNLLKSFDFLTCYYDFSDNDDEFQICILKFLKDVGTFCRNELKNTQYGYNSFLDFQKYMGIDKATPYLRAVIQFGINYIRTIYETFLTECKIPPKKDRNDSKDYANFQMKEFVKCNLRAHDFQSRKDVARLGYNINGQKGESDFNLYNFCQLESYPLFLEISFDLFDSTNQKLSTESFQFALWINLKASQSNQKKQAIQGVGVKNCSFEMDQFAFQRVLKTSEINTICNKTIQVIMGCLEQVLSTAASKHGPQYGSPSSQDYCFDKSFGDTPDIFVRVPDDIPLYYNFNCVDFEQWINTILENVSIQNLFYEMNDEFNNVSSKDQSQIDLKDFIELWKEFKLLCDGGGPESFYKINFPFDLEIQKMIYQFTTGVIFFRKRTVLRVNFYIIVDSTKAKSTDRKPFNYQSTQFCFEIEKSLTSSFESYFECFPYPYINPPLNETEIPWDYVFQVYIKLMKSYYLYLWKLKRVITLELSPFQIYQEIFQGLKIKLNDKDSRLLFSKNGSLINENGLFVNFKLEDFELLDFSLQIRNEGSFMTKTTIKTGYIEFYFFTNKFFEYSMTFQGGQKIDFVKVENQLKEYKNQFLNFDYLNIVKIFFIDVLNLYATDQYKEMLSSLNIKQTVDYERINKYMYTDFMSFSLFSLLLQYHILEYNYEMVDLARFEGFSLQHVFQNKMEYFYFKENEKYEDSIKPFVKVNSIKIKFDKSIEKEPQEILFDLEKLLFKEHNLNLQKPLFFLVGMPKIHRKMLITLYQIGGSLIEAVLLVFESQFYYKEIFIPFSSPYQISAKIQQILQETQKNEIEYLDNYLFNKNQKSDQLTIEIVKDLLEKANQITGYNLPFCVNKNSADTKLEIYVTQLKLFNELLSKESQSSKINECKSIEKMQKVIEIEDTTFGSIPSISLSITEPMKRMEKVKLNFSKGIFLKRHHLKKSLVTQLIFYKKRQKNEQHLIEKFLISHLKHFVEDEFAKIDEDMVSKLEEYFNKNSQL